MLTAGSLVTEFTGYRENLPVNRGYWLQRDLLPPPFQWWQQAHRLQRNQLFPWAEGNLRQQVQWGQQGHQLEICRWQSDRQEVLDQIDQPVTEPTDGFWLTQPPGTSSFIPSQLQSLLVWLIDRNSGEETWLKLEHQFTGLPDPPSDQIMIELWLSECLVTEKHQFTGSLPVKWLAGYWEVLVTEKTFWFQHYGQEEGSSVR